MLRWLVAALKMLAVVLIGFCVLLFMAGYLWAWAWNNTAEATEGHYREVQAEKRQRDSLRAAATQLPAPASPPAVK